VSLALTVGFCVGVECVLLPKVYTGCNASYQQYVQQEILPYAPLEQITGNEEAVIAVEYDKKR
jgi:hypothetical protein